VLDRNNRAVIKEELLQKFSFFFLNELGFSIELFLRRSVQQHLAILPVTRFSCSLIIDFIMQIEQLIDVAGSVKEWSMYRHVNKNKKEKIRFRKK
jgi:hypothetical protein